MTRADSDQVPSDLSERQLQVAALLVCGLSSREISDRLLVSDPLIRAEIKQILNKLGPDSVGTRAKLAVGLGWQNALISAAAPEAAWVDILMQCHPPRIGPGFGGAVAYAHF